MKKIIQSNAFKLYLMVFLVLMFLETAFRMVAMQAPIDLTYIHVVAFSLTYAAFIVFALRFFKPFVMKVILSILLVLLIAFYFSQNIYYEAMSGFYTFAIAADAGRGLGFINHLFINFSLWHLIYGLPLLIIPIIFKWSYSKKTTLADKVFQCRYTSFKFALVPLLGAWLLGFATVQTISSHPFGESDDEIIQEYSARDLYETNFSPELTINRFGLFTYARVDIRAAYNISKPNEDSDYWLEQYFEKRHHEDNDMTGIFEGKNLIFLKAESLDYMSLDPSLMPNLMSMMDSSIFFDNYYAPLYSRNTADTEFMTHTSFFPTNKTTLSMTTFGENHFVNTLPKGFNDLGYDTFSFHNYSDFYYPRTQFYLDTLEFDWFQDAFDMGLHDLPEDGDRSNARLPWLSDKLMVDNTIDDVLTSEQFFAYYLGVSGHLPYDDSQDVAAENLPIIEAIFEEEGREPVEQALMYYHAAHYEFDLALGVLLDKLEETGQADDTVILIASDHYPYGLERHTIDERSFDKDLEESRLNVHNVPMMIYHPSLEGEVNSNIISSIDLMPTIGNLFNLDLDYQYMMGRDVYEEGYNVVRFLDSSILTKDYIIEANQNLSVKLLSDKFTEDEVLSHYNEYIHYYQLSLYILETDYFHRKYIGDISTANIFETIDAED